MKTKVIFRNWRGSVIAIFPDQIDGRFNMSYQTIGQHGLCDMKMILDESIPTKDPTDLKQELENIGYELEII